MTINIIIIKLPTLIPGHIGTFTVAWFRISRYFNQIENDEILNIFQIYFVANLDTVDYLGIENLNYLISLPGHTSSKQKILKSFYILPQRSTTDRKRFRLLRLIASVAPDIS